MPNLSYASVLPIVLLVASNVFMTFAWYGNLAYKSKPLWTVFLASWGIALLEYCFAVPANRIGSSYCSTTELKTMQEVITFTVFIGFSVFWLGQAITLHHIIGFALIIADAAVVFRA